MPKAVFVCSGAAFAALCASQALASPSLADAEVSQAATRGLQRLYAGDEMLGVKPAIGLNAYNDSRGGRSTRAAYGVSSEFNLASALRMDFTRWFVGPQTGLLYSHLGNADASFFGSGSLVNAPGEGGANMFVIPTDFKVAYAPASRLRLGVHGGANVIYRSVPAAARIDDTDLKWRWIPNVGGDIDISFSRKVGLSIRPDWTLSPAASLFTASAALGISLG